MKTKIKRHSRSVLAVVLTLCMLVSCMTVGIIATDAANVTGKDDTALGASVENDDTVGAADDGESVGANVEFYYDFTRLTSGGYNYINESGGWSYGTDRSRIIKGSYPDNDSGSTIAQWEQGGWSVHVRVSDIPAGKNMLIATGDSTYEWGVYGESGGESEAKHAVTFSANPSAGGNVTPATGTDIGEQTSTQIEATPSAGYQFDGWTFGDGITYSSTTDNPTNITTKSSGTYSVQANFSAYTPTDSPFYYNSYGSDGQPAATHYGAQMTEAKLNGETYSYYHVTGRTESDQLFTVSYGTPKYNSYNTYFEIWSDWESGGVSAQFYTTDGKNLGDYTGMTYDTEANEKKKFKIAIPDGAREVQFKHSGSTTGKLSLASGNNAWYTNNKQGSLTDLTGYNSSNPVPVNFYENFNSNKYTDAFSTKGFYNHYANRGESHAYTKPKDFGEYKGDYYIVVLYQNKTYTINGVTKTISNDPEIIWMPELPDDNTDRVKVYAKDGTIRRGGESRNDKTYSTFEQHANTFVYSDSDYAFHIGTRSAHDGSSSEGSTGYNGFTYDYVNKFEKGQTLYIQTNLDSTIRTDYYLAAYSINGKSYALHDPSESDDGIVQEAFTVPEDWEDKYVEITPIYFKRDTTTGQTNTITFYVEGYDETVMNAGWGNTPFVYPFYQDANFNYVGNVNNAFGGYPGQPMVFYKGNYYIQLPKEITTTISTGQTGTATIKGVTLGNGYWDDIHLITGEVSSHFQTYDYDDLYKIYTEYPDQADHIICSFKYRTKKNNDEPGNNPTYSNYNSTNGNGWEVLTNYYGEPVDVFGNVLTEGSAEYNLAMSIINGSDSADSAAVVHAISQDYKSNSAGDYATEWVIYNTEGTKVVATSGGKTSIVPSALAIKADTTGADVASGFDKYDTATKAFKSIYTALYNDNNVRGKPAVVTYEKSIYGGGDKADRCDARWYFSQKNAPITATTRIEYTDNGKDWITDSYTSGTGTGSYTGAQAYFTGKAATAVDTPTDTTDVSGKNTTELSGTVGGGYYTFTAEGISDGTHGNYEFVGWYLLRDNYQNISLRSDYGDVTEFKSHAEQSKNGDIFVARFKKTATGTFDIYHEIHPQTSGYGTVTVSAIVKDSGGTQLASYPSSGTTAHVTIPSDYIRSGSGNTVVATFTATPYGTSNFEAFYETVQNLLAQHEEYGFITNVTINGTTATVTYDVNSMFNTSGESPVQTVSNVTHYSKFSLKTNLTYSLEYTFKTRYYGYKLYKYDDVAFTEQELRSYFLDQITDPECTQIKLDKQFVKAKAPFESNFREDLTWVVDNVTFNNDITRTKGFLTATQVERKWANVMVYDFDDNGEMVTATMSAPIEKLFKTSVTTKPTYEDEDEEAQAIENWSVDNDEMYHPIRTTYDNSGTTAPLYIHHWDIYQLDSFTYKTVNGSPKMIDGQPYNLDVDTDKSKLVAQAYSQRFNYVGYEDYAIVPVYSNEPFDRQGYSDSRTDSSATLLTTTRNNWTHTAEGNTVGAASGDRVYIDIMLNYNYSVTINGKQTNLLLNSTDTNVVAGFVVRSYTWNGNEKQYGNSKVVVVNKSQINDKNRIEYCYGFTNNENNRRAGLYYEFKPFIIDKNQTGAGSSITLPNNGGTYNSLYADNTVTVLDQVSFYQLGRL